MSESTERTHPVAGIVFAVILAVILVALLAMSAATDQAVMLAIVLVGWGVASVLIFGRGDDAGH